MENDDILIKQIDTWELFYSKEDKCLCIDTIDYHPPTLKLSRDYLKQLLDTVDKLSG